jgi:hypothetical protein
MKAKLATENPDTEHFKPEKFDSHLEVRPEWGKLEGPGCASPVRLPPPKILTIHAR